MLRHDAAS